MIQLDTVNPEKWESVDPIVQSLLKADVSTVEGLETWLLEWSKLSDRMDEVAALLYVNMTCDTLHAEHEKRYLDFMEHVLPRYKEASQQLREYYVASPARSHLPKDRYAMIDRHFAQQVKLFQEKNLALEVECDKLEQKYQKLIGGLTVQFDGKEQTLPAMGKYQEETDRSVREKSWRMVADRILQESESFESIYDDLVKLRHQIAVNAGFENYRDFMFAAKERFDYTPKDCVQFHDAVEHHVVPMLRALSKDRQQKLDLEVLRPWDLAVDPEHNSPLRPFKTSDELIQKARKVFMKVHAEFGETVDAMIQNKLLDLDNRKGKAPGGYQHSFEERRLPFIFMNATGMHDDVETLIHEGGHAFHYWAERHEPLNFHRHAPIEFCEVASMGMELLANRHLEEFYSHDEASRARRDHIKRILWVFSWVAIVDAFQHWVYTHPTHTREERKSEWRKLMTRFGGGESWEGLEPYLLARWYRQSHIFTVPFYYIEYGIAQMGALQLWQQDLKDCKHAIENYRRALTLGGTKPLPELFSAAGLTFDLGDKVMAPLMGTVKEQLASYGT